MYFAFQHAHGGREPVTFAERPYRENCDSAKTIIWSTLCKVPEAIEHLPLDALAKWYLETKEAR